MGHMPPPTLIPQTKIIKEKVPEALLTCESPPAPDLPDQGPVPQSEASRLLVLEKTAGQDCRDALQKIRDWNHRLDTEEPDGVGE